MVSAKTYRAKKMIWPMAMKLKKFHACPNHRILYRAIIGYDVPDTDPRLVNLDRMQRVLVRTKMQGEIKYIKEQYILQAMKKIRGNRRIHAAHQFG
jgi:hypothetical protein